MAPFPQRTSLPEANVPCTQNTQFCPPPAPEPQNPCSLWPNSAGCAQPRSSTALPTSTVVLICILAILLLGIGVAVCAKIRRRRERSAKNGEWKGEAEAEAEAEREADGGEVVVVELQPPSYESSTVGQKALNGGRVGVVAVENGDGNGNGTGNGNGNGNGNLSTA
ncbi:hypothetical protein MMC06_002103 [Schaereria dolodes]|nr:hypothetical protein [Schaereria dolodes]